MTRRLWTMAALASFVALVIFFPLRLALAIAGDSTAGISARNVSGTIWGGRAEEVRVGALNLGSLDIGLDPLALFTARLRLSFHRTEGAGAPLDGAVEAGLSSRALSHMTGTIAGPASADNPVAAITFNDFSAHLTDERCDQASGHLQVQLALTISGLDLRHGLSGDATCRSGALFIPLVGESGMERIDLTAEGDGRYSALLSIRSPDPALAAALAAAGLSQVSGGFGMTMRGQF
ncbi:MAG: type II secretion system protein N [Sphingopyxis sp.]